MSLPLKQLHQQILNQYCNGDFDPAQILTETAVPTELAGAVADTDIEARLIELQSRVSQLEIQAEWHRYKNNGSPNLRTRVVALEARLAEMQSRIAHLGQKDCMSCLKQRQK